MQKPEGEFLSNYSEDSLEILSAQLCETLCIPDSWRKLMKKVSSFSILLLSSFKRECQYDADVVSFDSHGVYHWGGLVLRNNKMKSKEVHLLKRRMRRQKLVCLIYLFRAIKTFRSTSLLWIPSHELKYPVICNIERTAHHNSAHKYLSWEKNKLKAVYLSTQSSLRAWRKDKFWRLKRQNKNKNFLKMVATALKLRISHRVKLSEGLAQHGTCVQA